MQIALYLAAGLLCLTCAAHSYLGEKYILMRLFRRCELPELWGSSEFTARTLRVVWHLSSVAWLGFAALMVLLARDVSAPRAMVWVGAATFAVHGVLALLASRGKHLSWIAFFAIAGLLVYASRG